MYYHQITTFRTEGVSLSNIQYCLSQCHFLWCCFVTVLFILIVIDSCDSQSEFGCYRASQCQYPVSLWTMSPRVLFHVALNFLQAYQPHGIGGIATVQYANLQHQYISCSYDPECWVATGKFYLFSLEWRSLHIAVPVEIQNSSFTLLKKILIFNISNTKNEWINRLMYVQCLIKERSRKKAKGRQTWREGKTDSSDSAQFSGMHICQFSCEDRKIQCLCRIALLKNKARGVLSSLVGF